MSEVPRKNEAKAKIRQLRASDVTLERLVLDADILRSDLAKHAEIVIALNQNLPLGQADGKSCQTFRVAPLESMQRGLKIQKEANTEASIVLVEFGRLRKE